ncbi:hypothetical protein DFH09DRAFT_1080979 [Mycena vulgaris]|nr:hypothetical protein DFH09DRAFT_1080979 [Mycena vulgaris]
MFCAVLRWASTLDFFHIASNRRKNTYIGNFPQNAQRGCQNPDQIHHPAQSRRPIRYNHGLRNLSDGIPKRTLSTAAVKSNFDSTPQLILKLVHPVLPVTKSTKSCDPAAAQALSMPDGRVLIGRQAAGHNLNIFTRKFAVNEQLECKVDQQKLGGMQHKRAASVLGTASPGSNSELTQLKLRSWHFLSSDSSPCRRNEISGKEEMI